MDVDDYETVKNEKDKPLLFNRIMPVYNPSIYGGLNQEFIRETVKGVLDSVCGLYLDVSKDVENARRAFASEFALSPSGSNIRKNRKTQKYEIQKTLLTAFKNNLKFEFTKDQKKAINDIFPDMRSIHHVNRMLMGDGDAVKRSWR